jgi:uncharacterized protein (UPF0332 family)
MMDGRDFIIVADAWATSTTVGEPTWRSSTSRAYYGAFHVAKDFLEVFLGFRDKFKGHQSHKHVHQALTSSDNPHAAEAGRKLSRLILRRHKADYELRDNGIGIQSAAQHSVENAEEITDEIDKAIASCRDTAVLQNTKSKILSYITANGL